MIGVSREAGCEGNNSNSSHAGLRKHGSSARLRHTAGPGARLRNPARRWHVCHSRTKAHLHNPTRKRHLCHSIAGTWARLRDPTRRWHVCHSGTLMSPGAPRALGGRSSPRRTVSVEESGKRHWLSMQPSVSKAAAALTDSSLNAALDRA
jgi:hypothetical protein